MKRNEWLKKEYGKLAEIVNAYKSEKVQLVIVERILPILEKDYKNDDEEDLPEIPTAIIPTKENSTIDKPKQVGATKALNEVLQTDFFTLPRTIGSIVNHCRDTFEGVFETNQFSGILAKLVADNKLIRTGDTDSNRFAYLKP